MSYQANLDMVVAMNILQISSFRKQGRLRFRVKLLYDSSDPHYHKEKHPPIYHPCSPYNTYRQREQPPSKPFESVHDRSQVRSNLSLFYPREQQAAECQDSYIDHEQQCYYSRVFESKFVSQQHPIEQCCYFRKCIKTDELDQSRLLIRVELFFKPLTEHKYVVAGAYEATIHKLSGFASFLPVTFDEFGGFVITGMYSATILEYRFSKEDEEEKQYDSFDEYLNAATGGFKAEEFRKFFIYYRSSLESQLNSIQEHHATLLGIVSPNTLLPIIKVNPNQAVLNIAAYLEEARVRSQHNSSYLKGFDDLKQRASHQISKDFTQLKALIHQKWNEYIMFLMGYLPIATEHYGNIYKGHVTDRLRTHAFSHRIEAKWDWTFSRYQDSGKAYLHQAEMDKLKHKEEEMWRDHFPIEVKHFFEDEGKNIKIFEEIYSVRGPILTKRSMSPSSQNNIPVKRIVGHNQHQQFSPRSQNSNHTEHLVKLQAEFGLIAPNSRLSQKFISEKPNQVPFLRLQRLHHFDKSEAKSDEHLVIFVHGFQASRQDFILFKSCLQIKFNCRVFISSTNEGRTDDSIEMLGKRLAVELNNLFKTIEFGPNTRISFVGHSMGGIIIRSALSYIKNLDTYLYSYMSFSSPHLGYLYEPSALVQAGLWLLNAWQKVSSLEELCMRDGGDPRKTLLYRLSENNSLRGFQQLAFLSSSQDEYVPYQSARIEKNNVLLEKVGVQNATVIKEMVDNMLGDIHAEQISRMNVVFNIEDRNFDSLVGRTAHIKYLSDQKFIKMFCLVFQKFFI